MKVYTLEIKDRLTGDAYLAAIYRREEDALADHPYEKRYTYIVTEWNLFEPQDHEAPPECGKVRNSCWGCQDSKCYCTQERDTLDRD